MAKVKRSTTTSPAVLPDPAPLASTEFKCDRCDAVYSRPTALGIHKRTAHGIYGKSIAAVAYRKQREKDAKSHKLQSRGRPPKSEIQQLNREGQGQINNDAISEVALAIAYGRLAQFCSGMATEYDVPPRLFTRRLFELVRSTPLW